MGRLAQFTTVIRSQLVIEAYEHWLKKHERVLDAGCGNGILSEILQKTFALKLTGCDVENNLQIKIPFVAMEHESSLPFPDKSFDAVMFNDTLHHMSFVNQKKLLKEALRVSDKVLIFEVEPTLIGSIADWSINKLHYFHMPAPLTFRSHSQWMQLFESSDIKFEFNKVRKPFLYPFTHESFSLSRK